MRLALLSVLTVCVVLACGRREATVLCGEERLGLVSAAVRVDAPGGQTPIEARVATLGSGFLVVWSAGTDGDSDLWARAHDLDGIPTGNAVPITLIAGRSDRPRVATGAGTIAIAWRDDRFGRNEALATVIGSAGLPAFPEAFRSGVLANDQDPQPAIALAGTAWAVVWNGRGPDGNDHLYVQGMDFAGSAIGAPFAVDAQLLDRATAPAAANVGGSLAVVDVESRPGATSPPDTFAYVLSPAFTPPFQRFAIEGGAEGVEIAALGAIGGLAWCAEDGIRFAAIGSAGVLVAERRIAPGCSPSIAGAEVAFLASWIGDDGIAVVQALTPTGAADGRATRLGEARGRPDVAFRPGRAAAVWTTPDSEIYLQPLGCTN